MCTPKVQIGVAVGGLGAMALRSVDHMAKVDKTHGKIYKVQLQNMAKIDKMSKVLEHMNKDTFKISAHSRKMQGQLEVAMEDMKLGKKQERHCMIKILKEIRRSSWEVY
jgi:hypothetical protein